MGIKRDWDIYIDVDGVLIYHNTEINKLCMRNGIIEFLYYCTRNFENCYWLTAWYDGFNEILNKVYAGDLVKQIKAVKYEKLKTEGINFYRNFLIIEDGLLPEEIKILLDVDCLDNYIKVPFQDEPDYLFKVIDIINSKIYK